MRTRPVFESYSAFVNHLYSAVNEEEGGSSGANVDFLLDSLKGVMKGTKEIGANAFDTTINLVNNFMNKECSAICKGYSDDLKNFFAKLGGKNCTIYQDGWVSMPDYNYLKDGYVSVIDAPEMKSDGTINEFKTVGDVVSMPLTDLLRGLFEYNLALLHKALPPEAGESSKPKQLRKSIDDYSVLKKGSKPNNIDDENRPLMITPESTKKSTIEIVKYGKGDTKFSGDTVNGASKDNEGILFFPIYFVNPTNIVKEGGKKAGTESYTDVVKPTEKSIPVENITFSSADYGDGDETMDKGEGFFSDNDTVITNGGMAEIRALISKFNKITKIVVSGSASNLPTKKKISGRSEGNLGLAEARRAAGMKALESIKDSGVVQLEGASIEEGTATVQKSGEAADPKKRNVTFTVSGQLKSIEGDLAKAGTDGKGTVEEPKTITKIVDKKFDRVRITQSVLIVCLNMKK